MTVILIIKKCIDYIHGGLIGHCGCISISPPFLESERKIFLADLKRERINDRAFGIDKVNDE